MTQGQTYEYPFFSHESCMYFPCHEGVAPGEFNCLYCHCPLYPLGPGCGGNFTYTADGVKDCSACTLPHEGDAGARMVAEHAEELKDLARKDA